MSPIQSPNPPPAQADNNILHRGLGLGLTVSQQRQSTNPTNTVVLLFGRLPTG
jgi:hypothetical protein